MELTVEQARLISIVLHDVCISDKRFDDDEIVELHHTYQALNKFWYTGGTS